MFLENLKIVSMAKEGRVVVGTLDKLTYKKIFENNPKVAYMKMLNPYSQSTVYCKANIQHVAAHPNKPLNKDAP